MPSFGRRKRQRPPGRSRKRRLVVRNVLGLGGGPGGGHGALRRWSARPKTTTCPSHCTLPGPAKRAGKGIKPVAQVEEEDEGAIQESRVDRAHKERADRRRGGEDAGTCT